MYYIIIYYIYIKMTIADVFSALRDYAYKPGEEHQ